MAEIMHKYLDNDTIMRAQKSFTLGWIRAFMEIKGISRTEINREIAESERAFLKSCVNP